MKLSSRRTFIGMILVWFVTIFYLLSTMNEYKTSGNQSNQDHLFQAISSIRDVKHQKEEIRNVSELWREIKILQEKLLQGSTFHHQEARSNVETDVKGPSLHHEEVRRRVETDVDEFWRYMKSKLHKLRELSRGKDTELIVNAMLEDGQALHRSAVNDLYALKNVDDIDEWRLKESLELGEIIQKRLNSLQHPKNCQKAKLFVCEMKNNCGFGCQLHHVVYCMITGYANNRTVVIPATHWQYAPSGWESVFQPISAPCLQANGVFPERDGHNILRPDVSSLVGVENDFPINNDYLPLAVPDDIADRLLRFHGNPAAWWIGQFVKYLLKFQPSTQKAIEEGIKRLNWTTPIAGIHVRRTDKVNHEAGKHEVEEYMVHIDEWYGQLKERQPVLKKRVFLASDDPNVLQEVQQKYPGYDFISDQEVSKSADPRNRYQLTSLYGVLQDIILLSRCNYLVCTFSSQICRLAYELMQTYNGDASSNVQSLDDMFYFGGQTEHIMDVREPHVPREQGEIRLDWNDSVGIAGNHWNGYSKGRNRRTGETGLFLAYKIKDRLKRAKMPLYNVKESVS
ncbi:hypothetical protein CHS0354_008259 [Potamilus streckersoni]|uniref:GT23 domain-containing protein n=1 Tax=Potamilus streckersoni TaxID=2493646 RepID=A0AAE0T7D2_9BIVA|nr:hypothetical protein CHS0354_008259 [Potamilus streckersoni]